LRTQGHLAASESTKEVAATAPDACTTACTSEPGNSNAGTVEALAAALLGLSAADRARLAAMLLARPKRETGR
jgi:hypothetical protein